MIASEKKSGKSHYKKGKAYSPILAEAADDMIDCRKELRKESVSTPRDEDKMEELKILLKEAKREFRIIQSKSHELREKFLQELYTKKAKAWKRFSSHFSRSFLEIYFFNWAHDNSMFI